MFYRISLFLLAFVVIVASAMSSLKSWVEAVANEPFVLPATQILSVEAGSSLNQLSRQFERQGWIESAYPLLIYNRINERHHIRAGEYEVKPDETYSHLVQRLMRGDVRRYFITFPEGRSIKQWLEIANNHVQFNESEAITKQRLTAHFKPSVGESLEGWFFPDTYQFTAKDDVLSVFAQAFQRMEHVLADQWQQRQPNLPINSAYEALILASIIEKETGVAEERGAIAGVFVRRLEKGMKLQTDPTVIYGLGERYKGNITRAHLREKTPYNTYHIRGLPPTPISNPGEDAIYSTLHPKEGNTLFFVAKGDGSHYFSATLAEHNKAVRQYQRRRVKQYRSSPQ